MVVHREKPAENAKQHMHSEMQPPTSALPSTEMKEQPGAIRCKHCKRVVAFATPDGLLPNTSALEAKGCDLCHTFLLKYESLSGAKAKYATFSDRRDTHGPKVDALIALRQARIDLENWLLQMETPHHAADEKPALFEEHQHGTKRSYPDSYPTKVCDVVIKPIYERCDSTSSLPERKKIKFSDTVEFRDDYRPAEQYSRSEKSYERGRYAPPEDAKYLDTSGSSKTFFKFTGYKKVGKDWVNLWKEEDEDEAKPGRLKKVKKTSDKKEYNSVGEGHGNSRDERTRRMTRRRSRDAQHFSVQAEVDEEPELERNLDDVSEDSRGKTQCGEAIEGHAGSVDVKESDLRVMKKVTSETEPQ